MARRLLYIASLGHSGSTMLDLLLGAHQDVLGLGEVLSTINRRRERQNDCTCGVPARECDVWGPVLAMWEKKGNLTIQQAYQDIAASVDNRYGSDKLIVDSSKDLNHLKYLHSCTDWDLSVLFLVRDVRGYILSTVSRPTSRFSLLGYSRLFRAAQWYRRNTHISSFLNEENIKSLQIGYEEICFQPEETMQMIADFIGITSFDDAVIPNQSESHILRGNKMRFDDNRRNGIKYDCRWFFAPLTQLILYMWPPLHRFNRQHVYGNVKCDRIVASKSAVHA